MSVLVASLLSGESPRAHRGLFLPFLFLSDTCHVHSPLSPALFLVTRSSLTAGPPHCSRGFPGPDRTARGCSRVLGLPREAGRRGVDAPLCSPPSAQPSLSVPVLREGGCVFYLPTTKTLTSR